MRYRLSMHGYAKRSAVAVLIALLACAVPLPARSEETLQPAADAQSAAPDSEPIRQAAAPTLVAAHPAFYPSQRQLYAWLDAGYDAFTTGVAHDDAFSVPGVNRWFWLPSEVVVIGDAGAVVGLSCETPQLLATYTAWLGTRSALLEAQVTDAVYSQLAQQAGYCRFVVVGLTKADSRDLALKYVLNVNGIRYGQPRISSPYDEPLSSSHSLLDRRDYKHLSVEVVERFDVDYVVDIQGQTYNRTQARSSVGYERRAQVTQREARAHYTHLVTKIVDFPLLRDDGLPLIPASAHTVTLEMLAPDASYEVSVDLTKDESYLRDEPPMTNPRAAVTMTAGQTPRITTAPSPRTPVVIRLEEVLQELEFKDQHITVCQRDAKIPVVLVSFPSDLKPSQWRATVRRLVEEGQKALTAGELTIIADVRGRRRVEGTYSPVAKRAVVRLLP